MGEQKLAVAALLAMGILLAWVGAAQGYIVGPSLSLEKLAAEADIIFKGTAVSIEPAQDEWFKPYPDFVTRETRFGVLSVIKGDIPDASIRFRHYDENPQPRGRMYEPQYYHFQSNRTYIVFGKKTENAAICRQLWANHMGKKDQGVLLCVDDKPVTAKTVQEVFWSELTRMLKDADAGNVAYAIRQLDQMSNEGNKYDGTQDFDRTNVLYVVHNLMTNAESRIAQAAIGVVASRNPYFSDERTDFWLATVGSAETPGLSKMDPKMRNVGGERYWKELVSVADADRPAETRAFAIRALGRVRESALLEAIDRWLGDGEAAVRAAATVLLSDFPGADTDRRLAVQAADSDPRVRACVARAIGFSQQAKLVDVLARLLADTNAEVRRVASVSLLSFSPKNQSVARVFQANLENKEFEPLFLNALAREDPSRYLDALERVLESKVSPNKWGGGEIPAFTTWKILFKYMQSQSVENLQSGKWDHALDALEKVGNYSSSEPRDIYAFYLLSGMPERARKFRERANKAASYDLDTFFKQVDRNPGNYRRE